MWSLCKCRKVIIHLFIEQKSGSMFSDILKRINLLICIIIYPSVLWVLYCGSTKNPKHLTYPKSLKIYPKPPERHDRPTFLRILLHVMMN